MEVLTLPISIAAVFVAGGIAIQNLGKWADQVRRVLGTLFLLTTMVVGLALLVRIAPPGHTNGIAQPAASEEVMAGDPRPSDSASTFIGRMPAAPHRQ